MSPRPLLEALFYEKDGDLNLGSLFLLIMGIVGAIGFLWVVIFAAVGGYTTSPAVQIAAWSYLAGFSASVLIASIPIARSKILANATLPGELAKSVASAAANVEVSTDIMELSQHGTKESPTTQQDI